MPALKQYHLFISHAWDYSEEYKRFVNLLHGAQLFDFHDYSVDRENPLATRTDAQLYEALTRQIRPASVVIVLAGMYTAHREWMQKEIEIARALNKPIIGVRPWGNTMVPLAVSNAAREVVGWQTASIVDAIRRNSV